MFQTVELAEIAFYQAFENASLDAMMAVWSASAEAVCIHPTGPALAGADAIRESWRQIFSGGGGIAVSVNVIREYASASLVIHMVEERLTVANHAGQQAHVLATNVYRLEDGGWRLLSHHGSPAPRRQKDDVAPTLH